MNPTLIRLDALPLAPLAVPHSLRRHGSPAEANREESGMNETKQHNAPRPATWLRKVTTGVCLAASVAPFLGTGAARGEPVAEAGVLIADGKARGVIYLAPEATPTARYAAAELRDHVKLATGAELPITNALPEEPATPVILVGPSAAAEGRKSVGEGKS